jgi:transcription initiation factor TFIIIB Brf1 subunit/transcription initiation factor TFIIB
MNPLLTETHFDVKSFATTVRRTKCVKYVNGRSGFPHKEKSLYQEFQFINIMAQNRESRKYIDHAMIIHKDISSKKLFRGDNRDGIKAASIYISCRLNGCPRTAFEIAEIFNLDKQSATNGCSNAINILQNIERNVDVSEINTDYHVGEFVY